MSFATQAARLLRRGLARSSAMQGSACTLRKRTLGAFDPVSHTRATTDVDHALEGALISEWHNVRFEKTGWKRVRTVILPAAILPDGVVPEETDVLVFEDAVWSIHEMQRPMPAAGYILHTILT